MKSGETVPVILTATDNVGVDREDIEVLCALGAFSVEDNTYTAPDVREDTTDKCTAVAEDAAGNEGTATLTVDITADKEPPVLTFTVAVTEVNSGGTIPVILKATDNVGIDTGPAVTCNRGSLSVRDKAYTAPHVRVDITAECTARARDAAGNEGRATLTISITGDKTKPVLTFSPATLTVIPGGTAASFLSAMDDIGITRGPVVKCDKGSYDRRTATYTAPAANVVGIDIQCTAVASDAAGREGQATLTISITAPDKTPPTLTFNPDRIRVKPGAAVAVTLTATDNVDTEVEPDVTCGQGSFHVGNNTYTAPAVKAGARNVDTYASCTASAFDAAGNKGEATLTVTIIALPPTVSFNPVSLTVASGGTGMSRVSVTSVSGSRVNIVPTVSCTNGGRYDTRAGVFTAPEITKDTFSVCTATATDPGGRSGSAMLTVHITPPPASCPDGFTESVGPPLGGRTLCTLTKFRGVLTQSATIPYVEGVVYELAGRLDVGVDGGSTCRNVTPVVLTIEAGVTIVGDSSADLLVVNRCHRIEAAGTWKAPIVFTSRNDIAGTGNRENATGEWGGVVILGDAPVNRCKVPATGDKAAKCENTITRATGPETKYGGANQESNSGTLEYVTVRQAGAGLNAGLTLGGIGLNTTVEYVQVHNSSGDGISFLGGTAKAEHLVLTGNTDDQLDTDKGHQGTVRYVVGVPRSGGSSDSGIEISARSDSSVSKFTLLAEDNTKSGGIRVNGGSNPSFRDGIVVDSKACLRYEASAGDDMSFESVLFKCPELVTMNTGDDPATGRKAVKNPDNNNVVTMDKPLDGFMPGPKARDVALKAGVNHIGAFNPATETNTDNWAAGWTRDLLPEPECPAGTVDAGFDMFGQNVCNISGIVIGELTLTRGNLYALSGRVDVGVDMGANGMAVNGKAAALVIESGVTVFGRSGADVVIVNRGSTITAEGTKTAPILFTSVQDVTGAGGNRLNAAGEWGGLVILGRAPINRCNEPSATGGTDACERSIGGVSNPVALHGGSRKDDNSGSLRYVQVKYAGSGSGGGVSLGGVGSGTKVEYVQVHNNSGDGIKYFGGEVNSKRLVLTGNGHDQMAVRRGYRGSIQYVIGLQRAGGNYGIDAGSAGLEPASNPVIANFTLVGADREGSGVRVRRGVIGTWLNGVVTGEGTCLRYERSAGDGVEGFRLGSDPAFRSVQFDCAGGLLTTGSDRTTGQKAVSYDRNNVTTRTNTLGEFVNGPAENAVPAAPAPQGNTFLETVDYIGAVRDASDTWWRGWTCGLEASDPC